jgi:hypothetical protein
MEFLFYLCPRSSVISRGALGELVNYKTLKSIHKPKFSEMSDIFGLQTAFQRPMPDMSGPLLILELT